MTDFLSTFWPWFIALITVVSVAGCALLLWLQSRPRLVESLDPESNSTGHVWDEDLKELNNPMPRWWMGLFVLTIIFGVIYFLLYPSLVVYEGKLGWGQISQYEQERGRVSERMTKAFAPFEGKPLNEVALMPAALEMGERLFMNNCAQCHGSDARGSKGFPNLTDSDWLWGSSPEAIVTTIRDGRQGMMPSMVAAVGGDEGARDVANYVLTLSGRKADSIRAARGQTGFANACAACHGADGKGNIALGAPNLTDKVWLHGGAVEDIVLAIQKGRQGMMPAHNNRLSSEQINLLAAYVLRISNSVDTAKVASNP